MVDKVIIDSPDTAQTPPEGHDAAMAALVDNAGDPDAAPPAAPEEAPKFAGKYGSVEELEKGYAELQKKLGNQDKADEPSTDTPPDEADKSAKIEKPDAENPDVDAAKEAVEAAGLDFDSYSNEFAEKGELSEGTYEALEKAGIPKDMVDQFIAGQQAVGAQVYNSMMETAGGEEAYQGMLSWAAENFAEGEIDAFNATIDAGDLNSSRLAIAGLKARYDASEGNEPTLTGGNNTSTDGAVYESWAQVTADMSDPRYKNDSAYRNKVSMKLGRSNI